MRSRNSRHGSPRGSGVTRASVLEAVLRRDRQVVTLVLVTVITASWLYLLAGSGTGMYPQDMTVLRPLQAHMDGMSMPPVVWTPGYALLMFLMWWLMMVAMMLPSAAPMVLFHAAVTRKALANTDAYAGDVDSRAMLSATTAFVAGYLLMWGAFSFVAVLAQWALERAGLLSAMMMTTSSFLASGLLLAAGSWQLSPLKAACLRHCRSPLGFVNSSWRPGVGGAFRMGVKHGVLCLGCCWFLMALMFYGGVMNLIWIIGLALFALAEKIMPAGVAFGRVSGVILIGWGAWLGITAI